MDIRELFKLATNSLRANKMRSTLTTLGIIIGVFSVIVLVAVGNGLQTFITDQVSSLGSNLMYVMPGKIGGGQGPGEGVNRLTFPLASYLENRVGNSAYVSPYISKITTLKYGNRSNKNTQVIATNEKIQKIINYAIVRGTLFTKAQNDRGSNVIVIGPTVRDNLFKSADPIGKKVTLSGRRYTVIGLLEKRGSVLGQDQDNVAIIPVTTAKEHFSIESPTYIFLSAKESELVPFVKKRAEEILKSRLEEDDFTVMTSEQQLNTITTITSVLTIVLAGIAAISLLVGGIGVMNIMLVSVTERTKEIGLRKALGAKRRDILMQFLLEAVMLSLLGGGIGVFLGIVAASLISIIFTTTVTWWSVLLAFGFSATVGIVFGIAPAIRASRLSPIEALRYE